MSDSLRDPMDCSLPGSSVHGIFQAIVLEWIAVSFSRGSPRFRAGTQISCIAGGFFTTESPGKSSQCILVANNFIQIWSYELFSLNDNVKGSTNILFLFESMCFQTVMLEKTLESPSDCKEIKPVNPKGNQPEYSLEGLMLKLKLQYFDHLMQRADSLEKTLLLGKIEDRRRRGRQRMRWLASITDSGHEYEQTPGDGEGQGSLACCSPWGCRVKYN